MDPKPNINESHFSNLTVIQESATSGMQLLFGILTN